MDRLAGDGGGLPSRSFLLSADGTWGSWRVNASARWKDGYRVRRDAGVDGPDDLRVKALGLVDLRLTYRLDRFHRQARQGDQRGIDVELELELTNLFDARPTAAMADGRSARGYGRYDHDPIGRTILFGIKGRF